MSATWTLAHGGDERTLAAWGLADLTLTRRSQAADTLAFTLEIPFDAALPFPTGAALVLKRDGARFFEGVVPRKPRRRASAEGESLAYELQGPWWWLEQIVYQQFWNQFSGGVIAQQRQSRTVLGASLDGSPLATGGQIADAVNFAIFAGAPLQLGTVSPALIVPTEEGRDLMCAEVVKRMLRWHPDVVAHVDYATSPPTLHFRARAALPSVSLACAGAGRGPFDVQECDDLVPPVVVIKYEVTDSIDGQERRRVVVDKHPAGEAEVQPRALVQTFNLQGVTQSFLRQRVKTENIEESSLDWWKKRLPWLGDAQIKDLALSGGIGPVGVVPQEEGATVHDRELIEGQIADWMGRAVTPATAMATVDYDVEFVRDGQTIREQHRKEIVKFALNTTNAATGEYAAINDEAAAEPVPSGVAEAYYAACQEVQWQGFYAFSEDEVGADGLLGSALNLTGGLAAWASMRALIYQVTQNIGTGETRIEFGPVPYLNQGDRIALMRNSRARQAGSRYERAEALRTGGAQRLGEKGPRQYGGSGAVEPLRQVIVVGDKTVTVDTAGVVPESLPDNLTVKLRSDHALTGEAGDFKQRLVMMSEPFAPTLSNWFAAIGTAAASALSAAVATLNAAIATVSGAASAAAAAASAAQSTADGAQTAANTAQSAADAAQEAADEAYDFAQDAFDYADDVQGQLTDMQNELLEDSLAYRIAQLEVDVADHESRLVDIEEFLEGAGYVIVLGDDGHAYGLRAFEIEDLGDRRVLRGTNIAWDDPVDPGYQQNELILTWPEEE